MKVRGASCPRQCPQSLYARRHLPHVGHVGRHTIAVCLRKRRLDVLFGNVLKIDLRQLDAVRWVGKVCTRCERCARVNLRKRFDGVLGPPAGVILQENQNTRRVGRCAEAALGGLGDRAGSAPRRPGDQRPEDQAVEGQ